MKVLSVFGTRPELIKLAPVLRAFRAAGDAFDVRVCVTAQHRDLLDPLLAFFGVTPDHDLDLMRPDQSLSDITARMIAGLAPVMAREQPDWVLVQGDTTTTMTAALSALYHRVRIGHIEAGLRTGRLDQPFPEEANRRLVAALADLHFVPTATARDNLLRERVPADRILVTGNTGIDALQWAVAQPPGDEADRLLRGVTGAILLVTAHRRESFGAPLEQICLALRDLADRYGPALHVIYPVHPNPHVDGPVRRQLSGIANITLTSPVEYLTLVHLMNRARLVLTDSGGLQEEAPSLGIPVLVARETTERPEGIAAGTARLVGTDRARIVGEAARLIDDAAEHAKMARAINPYGDGQAAGRIVAALGAQPLQGGRAPTR